MPVEIVIYPLENEPARIDKFASGEYAREACCVALERALAYAVALELPCIIRSIDKLITEMKK